MKTNEETFESLRVVRQAIEEQFGKPARAAFAPDVDNRIAAKLIVYRLRRMAAQLTMDGFEPTSTVQLSVLRMARGELYELADEIEERLSR